MIHIVAFLGGALASFFGIFTIAFLCLWVIEALDKEGYQYILRFATACSVLGGVVDFILSFGQNVKF